MASFAETDLDGDGGLQSGAVLFLQDPARKTARLTTSSGAKVSTTKGSTGLVVAIPARATCSGALEFALDAAQVSLDVWAIQGVMARTVGDVWERHIVWWLGQDGPAAQIWTAGYLTVEMEARGEVRDRCGSLLPPQPQPPPAWHPSFRFFRLGQAATDLVEAFRNIYLAVESLLSTIEPIRIRGGRPTEREIDWLARALTVAGKRVDLQSYVKHAPSSDPVADIMNDIYRGTRTQVFHAKSGAAVMLPHDDATRTAVRGSLDRLRRLYIDLARDQFDMTPGGFRIAPALFQAMAEAVGDGAAYVSAEPVDEPAIEAGHVPLDAETVTAVVDESLRRDYFSAVVGLYDVATKRRHLVRQVGLLHSGVVGVYEDLGGDLDVAGFKTLRLVVATRGEDPKALGTRYKS